LGFKGILDFSVQRIPDTEITTQED